MATKKKKWDGLCRNGLHGLDFKSQPCDLCNKSCICPNPDLHMALAVASGQNTIRPVDCLREEPKKMYVLLDPKHRCGYPMYKLGLSGEVFRSVEEAEEAAEEVRTRFGYTPPEVYEVIPVKK